MVSLFRLLAGLGMLGLILVVIHECWRQRRKAAKERELKAAVMDEEVVGLEEEIDRKRKEAARRQAKFAKEEE